MAEELDWSGLEAAVKKVAAQLEKLREENRDLRRDLKAVRKELDARPEVVEAPSSPLIEHADEIQGRLETLEAELSGLLAS
jgi:chromosome segregation ATPase